MDRPVKKNIGRMFQKYNILEYKGPGDSLNVDDFYKVYGYTCFYKTDVPFVNSIPASELTMIIVTRQLSEKENLWLKSLTNNLNETKRAEKLINDYLENKENSLYHSVIEIIAHANQKTFEEVNGMSDIFMEIVKEKFDRKLKEEVDRAKEEMAQQVTEEITQQVTEEITQQVTEEVTQQVTQNVTQQVTHKTRLLDCIILVKKKCAKNKTLSTIADELESEPDEIMSVYDAVVGNPGKTAEEIYELVVG